MWQRRLPFVCLNKDAAMVLELRYHHINRASTPIMNLSAEDKKHYRSIGHQLKPVVLLGAHGITEPLLLEINRALDDHELIKVRIHGEDRDSREAAITAILAATGAVAVQRIGKILLLLRRTEKPNPRLSNLMRHTRA